MKSILKKTSHRNKHERKRMRKSISFGTQKEKVLFTNIPCRPNYNKPRSRKKTKSVSKPIHKIK